MWEDTGGKEKKIAPGEEPTPETYQICKDTERGGLILRDVILHPPAQSSSGPFVSPTLLVIFTPQISSKNTLSAAHHCWTRFPWRFRSGQQTEVV